MQQARIKLSNLLKASFSRRQSSLSSHVSQLRTDTMWSHHQDDTAREILRNPIMVKMFDPTLNEGFRNAEEGMMTCLRLVEEKAKFKSSGDGKFGGKDGVSWGDEMREKLSGNKTKREKRNCPEPCERDKKPEAERKPVLTPLTNEYPKCGN